MRVVGSFMVGVGEAFEAEVGVEVAAGFEVGE